jgi:hypothetical protein
MRLSTTNTQPTKPGAGAALRNGKSNQKADPNLTRIFSSQPSNEKDSCNYTLSQD